jgi:hypothetical protein
MQAFPPYTEPPCDYPVLSAKVIGENLGEPIEFLRFLHGDIVGQFGSGENFLYRLPLERFSHRRTRSHASGAGTFAFGTRGARALGCSLTECALLKWTPPTLDTSIACAAAPCLADGVERSHIDTYRLCVRDPTPRFFVSIDRLGPSRTAGS